MAQHFEGIVIAESLADISVLLDLEIVSTEVQQVAQWHQTPWLERWTLHTVRIPAERAAAVAEALSRAIDPDHATAWYADFKDDRWHYVVFRDMVFCIDRSSPEEYQAAVDYCIAQGLPPHQADFVSLLEPDSRR